MESAIIPVEVPRTGRLDRPYEILSRPQERRIIDTPERLLELQRHVMRLHSRPAPREVADILIARVRQGWWGGECPCGDCPIIDPEWQLACCLFCGAIYRYIALPPDAAAIEATLMKRPYATNRNWSPGETVADLEAENAANGVAS